MNADDPNSSSDISSSISNNDTVIEKKSGRSSSRTSSTSASVATSTTSTSTSTLASSSAFASKKPTTTTTTKKPTTMTRTVKTQRRYPLIWMMIVCAILMSIIPLLNQRDLLMSITSITGGSESMYNSIDCPTIRTTTATNEEKKEEDGHDDDRRKINIDIAMENIEEENSSVITKHLITKSSPYQLIIPTNTSKLERLSSSSSSSFSTKVVYMVLSRRNSFEVRQAIRETWASSASSSVTTNINAKTIPNVFFVVGQACNVPVAWRKLDEGGNPLCQVKDTAVPGDYSTLVQHQMKENDVVTKQLLDEFMTYQDMIIVHHIPDVYRSLPQKLKAAYTFVDRYLPTSIEWIVKIDDDFYVRPIEFEQFLLQHYPLSTTTTTTTTTTGQQLPMWVIGGSIRRTNKAHTGGKWREVPQFPYNGDYPPFPLGSRGHAVTRSVASYVAKHKDWLLDYQGEDTSLGIWLSPVSSVKWTDVNPEHIMVNHGNCRDERSLIIGHDVTPAKMRQCFNMKNNNNNNNNKQKSITTLSTTNDKLSPTIKRQQLQQLQMQRRRPLRQQR